MRQAILLKAIEEWLGDILHVLHNHNALKVLVDSARLDVGPNGDAGIVTRARVGIDPVETPVEEVVEALMDPVRLAHDNCVTLSGGEADGSNGVDL